MMFEMKYILGALFLNPVSRVAALVCGASARFTHEWLTSVSSERLSTETSSGLSPFFVEERLASK